MAFMDRFRRRPEEEEPMTPSAYGYDQGGLLGSAAPADYMGTVNSTVGVGAFERPSASSMIIDESLSTPVIGKDQVRDAMQILMKYKAGKSNFDRRVIENEQWWKLRHWEEIKERGTTELKAKSAWLVNVILSKHADAMDALPEPNCLPRARDDEAEAARLSKIVPVVLQQTNFDLVWSDNWWKKLKAGAGIYGVFWDKDASNGMGDIAVRKIDPLSIFWEPGITDIQDSRNVFVVNLVDNETLEEKYPVLLHSPQVLLLHPLLRDLL